MRLLLSHLGEASPIELQDGLHVLGGGPDDDIVLEPLPPAFISLRVEGPHLTIEAAAAVSVDGIPFPGREARELLRGEVVALPAGISLHWGEERDAAAPAPTRALFWQMLGEPHRPPTPGLARLFCVAGRDRGRIFPLGRKALEVGRGNEAHVRLRDRSVSRAHARLTRGEGHWMLEDLGAPNGVWLGGQRIRGPTAIQDGCLLELGRTVLRLQAPDAPRPLPPPRPAPRPPWRAGERGLIASCVALAILGTLVGFAVLP